MTTLHYAVADALAKRRENIVAEIEGTERLIEQFEDNLVGRRRLHEELLAGMRAIDDAVDLLTNIDTDLEET